MNDWSKDINLETIKEYLQECAENDDYHYEQYQIDIVMHEYIRQKQIIERLNNIIKEVREYIQDRYDGEVLTHTFDKDNVGELLEILDKGSEKE